MPSCAISTVSIATSEAIAGSGCVDDGDLVVRVEVSRFFDTEGTPKPLSYKKEVSHAAGIAYADCRPSFFS